MTIEKTVKDVEAQADAMIGALQSQRNKLYQDLVAAHDQIIQMAGHIAMLEKRMEPAPVAAPEEAGTVLDLTK